jgi:hypothetical protein
MRRDLHNNVKVVQCINPITAGTTGTGRTGVVVDTRGYDAVEFIFNYGAITATGATFTVSLLEGDVTGTLTTVAAANMIGTAASAGLAAAARVDGSTENVSKKLGYKGAKRYVNAKIVNTATAGTPVSCLVVMGRPTRVPVA